MNILITGATSGIGLEMALQLSKDGNNLFLTGRNIKKLEKIKRFLISQHKKNSSEEKEVPIIEVFQTDLSEIQNCYRLYDWVNMEMTKINSSVDVLINNAGVGNYGNFWETSLQEDLNIIALNLTSVHILTKLFLKDFKRKNKGYIMNVSSFNVFSATPLMATYNATKTYVFRMTQSIAEELKQKNSNVRICVLCPGPVSTNFNSNLRISKNETNNSQSPYIVSKIGINKLFNSNNTIIFTSLESYLAYIALKTLPVPESLLSYFAYKFQENKNK